MKFLAGLAIAASLVSSAIAAKDAAAPVFIFRKQQADTATSASPSTPPVLPRQLVRHILLHRLGNDDGRSSFYDTLPDGYDPEQALDLIRQFGAPEQPLIVDDTATVPRQAAIIVQNVSPDEIKTFTASLPKQLQQPAFVVADPPSNKANKHLLFEELSISAVHKTRNGLGAAVVPDHSSVELVDAATIDHAIDRALGVAALLNDKLRDGSVEILIMLVPKSSSSNSLDYGAELRKREADFETVMVEDFGEHENTKSDVAATDDSSSSSSSFSSPHAWAAVPTGALPSCFSSFNACVARTANCSSHGVCIDKYVLNRGSAASESAENERAAARQDTPVCFACHCYSTLNRPQDSEGGLSTTQWAGAMCHKKDVSVPFWLIAGFTVTIVGALSFAIGLLFSVGEEKLPGVIGAGVSRSK